MVIEINKEIGASYKEDGEVTPWYVKNSIGLLNAILIVFFWSIYGTVSTKLVNAENHRYQASFENSMINKVYMFQFVNTYIGNFAAILYSQNFGTLMVNLITIMVVKQLFMNTTEYYEEKKDVSEAIEEVEKLFAEKI